MAKDLFSVPIFFIVFRETLEAAIILSVLFGIIDQLIYNTVVTAPVDGARADEDRTGQIANSDTPPTAQPESGWEKTVLRKLRLQILAGAVVGFILAMGVGAAFVALWFTKGSDIWGHSEQLWEGVLDLFAALIIFGMGLGMLRVDRAKAKWRAKLMHMFNGKQIDGSTRTSRYALFFLPFVTILREGIEAFVFIGGVSLGQKATAIPIAAVVGILCGLLAGYAIYAFASRTTLTIFLVFSTNFLFLIGAGLFSKSVDAFERRAFNVLTGGDVAEGGDGPGSYRVQGNVWHLNCCSPENKFDGNGWNIFAAIFGWTNSASVGSVLAYVFYWVAIMVALVYMKYSEGRTTLFGIESKAAAARRARKNAVETAVNAEELQVTNDKEGSTDKV